jgi:general secretion pathway protein G
MKFRNCFSVRRAFTLIELLVVIVIIGILAVGFAPTLLNAPKKARDGVRKGQLEQIRKAVDAYALDNNSTYPDHGGTFNCFKESQLGVAAEKYFQGGTLPQDPSGAEYETYGAQCKGDFLYRKIGETSGCYILGMKPELSSNGNSDDAISALDCAKATSAGKNASGAWFYKTVNF